MQDHIWQAVTDRFEGVIARANPDTAGLLR
jgi:hypothetical protein